jgi:hypothetical protein
MKHAIVLLLLLAGAFAMSCEDCNTAWGTGSSCYGKPSACYDEDGSYGVCKDAADNKFYADQAACTEDACFDSVRATHDSDLAACQATLDQTCINDQAKYCAKQYADCTKGCQATDCRVMDQCANVCIDRTNTDCSGAVVEYESDESYIQRCGCMCGDTYQEYSGLHLRVDCNAIKKTPSVAPPEQPPVEQPPAETATEVCGNNIDDDGNGLVDCLDYQQCDCSETATVTALYKGEDGANRPLNGLEANFTWNDGSSKEAEANAKTDSSGKVTVELPGIWQGDGSLSATAFFKDKTFVFYVNANGQRSYYNFWADVKAAKESDLAIDLKARTIADTTIARMWERLHQVYGFYTDYVGADVDYQMPEDISLLFDNCDKSACHSGGSDHVTDYGIYYGAEVFSLGNYPAESPQNEEWHEFNHHAMYAIYGGGWNTQRLSNHNGWGNAASDDSYLEAFAEYMSLLESLQFPNDYPRLASRPGVYFYDGAAKNLEQNINIRATEEFAIAGILWDLTDGENAADKDHVQLSGPTIWGVLSKQHAFSDGETRFIHSTHDLYEAFAALDDAQLTKTHDDANNASETWMDSANALQKIFISHGAYFDKNQNGEWDIGEPVGNTPMRGSPTEIRRDARLPPGSFIKANVKDTDGNTIMNGTTVVTVRFDPPYDYLNYDYEGDFQNGLIPVAPPYDAPLTYEIKVKADTGVPSEAITLTSGEYAAAYDAGKQFFAEKSFTVIRGIPDMAACNNDGACQTGEGSDCADCATSPSDEGGVLVLLGGLGLLAVVGVIGVVAVIAVAAFFLLRKKAPVKPAKRK